MNYKIKPNEVIFHDNYVEYIFKGKNVLVDKEDYENKLKNYKWRGGVENSISTINNNYMHKVIMNTDDTVHLIKKYENFIDYRKKNLKIASINFNNYKEKNNSIILKCGLIIDKDDYNWLKKYRWRYYNNSKVFKRVLGKNEFSPYSKDKKYVLMHREIGKIKPDITTKFINGNRLDLRKKNIKKSRYLTNSKGDVKRFNGLPIIINDKGYPCIRIDGKSHTLHSIIMKEEIRERKKEDNTIQWDVHHIDGNKLNYDKNNLIVLSNSEHIKIHRRHLDINFVQETETQLSHKKLWNVRYVHYDSSIYKRLKKNKPYKAFRIQGQSKYNIHIGSFIDPISPEIIMNFIEENIN